MIEVHSDQAKDTSKMSDPDKDAEKDDVLLVEESPTQYDGNRLPRTIQTNRFTSVVTHTHTIRTQIVKCMKNMDKAVAQIELLEKDGEAESDGDEFLEDLYKEIQSENKEVKEKLKRHEELTSQIRTMCGYIERSNANSTLPLAVKGKADATAALVEAENAEESLEKKVTEWSTANLNWLKGRKRKKSGKSNSVSESGVKSGKSTWLATFEKTLMPKDTLKADSDVTEMQNFKKSMSTWINYIKEEGTVVTNARYWHILANLCDPSMRMKLEAINGIESAGEVKIWEYIESIYQTTNPGYIRRHKCWGLK